jgi:hypothetical protein
MTNWTNWTNWLNKGHMVHMVKCVSDHLVLDRLTLHVSSLSG